MSGESQLDARLAASGVQFSWNEESCAEGAGTPAVRLHLETPDALQASEGTVVSAQVLSGLESSRGSSVMDMDFLERDVPSSGTASVSSNTPCARPAARDATEGRQAGGGEATTGDATAGDAVAEQEEAERGVASQASDDLVVVQAPAASSRACAAEVTFGDDTSLDNGGSPIRRRSPDFELEDELIDMSGIVDDFVRGSAHHRSHRSDNTMALTVDSSPSASPSGSPVSCSFAMESGHLSPGRQSADGSPRRSLLSLLVASNACAGQEEEVEQTPAGEQSPGARDAASPTQSEPPEDGGAALRHDRKEREEGAEEAGSPGGPGGRRDEAEVGSDALQAEASYEEDEFEEEFEEGSESGREAAESEAQRMEESRDGAPSQEDDDLNAATAPLAPLPQMPTLLAQADDQRRDSPEDDMWQVFSDDGVLTDFAVKCRLSPVPSGSEASMPEGDRPSPDVVAALFARPPFPASPSRTAQGSRRKLSTASSVASSQATTAAPTAMSFGGPSPSFGPSRLGTADGNLGSRPATVPAAPQQQQQQLQAAARRPGTSNTSTAQRPTEPSRQSTGSAPAQSARHPRPRLQTTAAQAAPHSARQPGRDRVGTVPSQHSRGGQPRKLLPLQPGKGAARAPPPRAEESLASELQALLPVYQVAARRVPLTKEDISQAASALKQPQQRNTSGPRDESKTMQHGRAAVRFNDGRPTPSHPSSYRPSREVQDSRDGRSSPRAGGLRRDPVQTAVDKADPVLRGFHDLRQMLVEREGSSLTAWLRHFDANHDMVVTREEFLAGMNAMGCGERTGNDVGGVFDLLDTDGNGTLSLDEIDHGQALLWQEFRHWCSFTFDDIDDFVRCLSREESTMSIQHRIINQQDFNDAIRSKGWSEGCEELLFNSMDIRSEGRLTYWNLTWFQMEKKRWQLKESARAKTVQLKNKRKTEKFLANIELQDFKLFLKAKFGSLIRGWRCAFSQQNNLVVSKPNFLKACRNIGYPGNARIVWQALDRDCSNIAAVEELDYTGAKHLANFQAWIKDKFGSISGAFSAFDPDKNKVVRFDDFTTTVKKYGYRGPARLIFGTLDADGSKFLVEENFSFLKDWKPPSFMLAEPKPEAAEEFKACLKKRYKDILRGWRQALDVSGDNRCNWGEFQSACRRISFQGDHAGAWLALDTNGSGTISLKELDPTAHKILVNFKRWCDTEFGSVRSAFGIIDKDGSGSISRHEFTHGCRIFGYRSQHAMEVMKALDIDNNAQMKMIEMVFLDDWEFDEVGQMEVLAQPQRRASSSRASTIAKNGRKTAVAGGAKRATMAAGMSSKEVDGGERLVGWQWNLHPNESRQRTPRASASPASPSMPRKSLTAGTMPDLAEERTSMEEGSMEAAASNPYLSPGRAAWQSSRNRWVARHKAGDKTFVASLLGKGAADLIPTVVTREKPKAGTICLAEISRAGRRPAPGVPCQVLMRPESPMYSEVSELCELPREL